MAIVGGGGQAELATVHERQAMPVPDALDWPAGGRHARGLHDGARRDLHPGRAARGRAPARPRRRRRRRDGRGPARRGGRRARHGDRCRAEARDAVAELGAHEVLDPEGFEEHGPFDVILELVGAPNLAANLKARRDPGRIVVIGIGAGAKGEINLRDLMRGARRLRASTLRPRPLEEKAITARGDGAPRPAAVRGRRAARARSPRRSRSTARPRPTTGSPRAARSARSSWCRDGG